jgi:hypothetical protein
MGNVGDRGPFRFSVRIAVLLSVKPMPREALGRALEPGEFGDNPEQRVASRKGHFERGPRSGRAGVDGAILARGTAVRACRKPLIVRDFG